MINTKKQSIIKPLRSLQRPLQTLQESFQNKKQLYFISFAFAFIFFGYNASQQFIAGIYNSDGNKNIAFISLAIVYSIFIISMIFAPLLIKKIGTKKAMLISTICYAFYPLAIAAKNIPFLYFASILVGLGAGTLWNGLNLHIVTISDKKEYGRNLGIFYFFLSLGSVLGILITSALIEKVSLFSVMLMHTIMILASMIFIFLSKETVLPENAIERNLLHVFKEKKIYLIIAALLPIGTIGSLLYATFAVIVSQKLGLAAVGYVTLIGYITPMLIPYISGRISDNKSKEKIMFIAIIIGLAALSLVYFSLFKEKTLLWGTLLGIFLLFTYSYTFKTVTNSLVADYFQNKNVGNALSIVETCNTAITAIFLLLNTILPGIIIMYIVMIMIICSLIPIIVLIIQKEKEKKQTNKIQKIF